MIEMVNSQRPISAAAVKGKYLVMSLPMSAYRTVFPGTPIFVSDAEDGKARMKAWPIKAHFSDNGICQDVRIMRADGPLSNRLEPMTGFICDNEADVVALMNCRPVIMDITSKAGYVDDAVIARELEALYSDVIDASKVKSIAPDVEKTNNWAYA